MEQNLQCPGGHPKDEWWIFDPEREHELVEKAKRMVGARKCAMCYAVELDQQRYREGKGDMKGRYWTAEEPAGG